MRLLAVCSGAAGNIIANSTEGARVVCSSAVGNGIFNERSTGSYVKISRCTLKKRAILRKTLCCKNCVKLVLQILL
jgi:uncharacterized circularly permuted ATP-grasp superfamily protein